MDNASALRGLQRNALAVFFSMPESDGFLLTGASAMIVAGLVDRPTNDIDLAMSPQHGSIPLAAAAFRTAATEIGWQIETDLETPTFCRLLIRAEDDVVDMDLVQDSPPTAPTVETSVGPSLGPDDLVARKTLALFGRAAERDFADVYALAQRFGKERLLELAAQTDLGFDRRMFAGMFRSLELAPDSMIPAPTDTIPKIRAFFAEWSLELTRDHDVDHRPTR